MESSDVAEREASLDVVPVESSDVREVMLFGCGSVDLVESDD